VLTWVEGAAVLVTAAATVTLAFFTWRAVRSGDSTAQAANRAAEAASSTALAAQQTLALQTRAFLVPARRDDPAQHIVFHGGHWLEPDAAGGRAVLQDTCESIYMGIALRNVGFGLALLYRWHLSPGLLLPETPPGDYHTFIPLTRTLHVPPGDVGFWQAQAHEELRPIVRAAVAADEPLTIDLLYGNEEGGQGRITRFHLRALADHPPSKGERSCEVARHWGIDTLAGSWPEHRQLRLRAEPAAPST
jgi:hypothetical protein